MMAIEEGPPLGELVATLLDREPLANAAIRSEGDIVIVVGLVRILVR